jgi:hypothetical protein
MFKKKVFFVTALILGVMLAFTLIGCGGGDSGGGGSDDGYPSDEDYKQGTYAYYEEDHAQFAEDMAVLNAYKGWNLSSNPHDWSSADWRKYIDFIKETGGNYNPGGGSGDDDSGDGGSDSSGLSAAEQSVWDGIKMAYNANPETIQQSIQDINSAYNLNLPTNPNTWTTAQAKAYYAAATGGGGSGDDGSGSDSSGLTADEQQEWAAIKEYYALAPDVYAQFIEQYNVLYGLNLPTNPNNWTNADVKAYYNAVNVGGGSGDDGGGGSSNDNSGGSLTAAEQQAWNNLKMAYGITPTDIEDLIRSFNEEQGQNLPLNPNDWSAAQAKIFFTVVENGPGD